MILSPFNICFLNKSNGVRRTQIIVLEGDEMVLEGIKNTASFTVKI